MFRRLFESSFGGVFSFWQPQRAVKGRIAHVAHGGVFRGLSPLTARFAAR